MGFGYRGRPGFPVDLNDFARHFAERGQRRRPGIFAPVDAPRILQGGEAGSGEA